MAVFWLASHCDTLRVPQRLICSILMAAGLGVAIAMRMAPESSETTALAKALTIRRTELKLPKEWRSPCHPPSVAQGTVAPKAAQKPGRSVPRKNKLKWSSSSPTVKLSRNSSQEHTSVGHRRRGPDQML